MSNTKVEKLPDETMKANKINKQINKEKQIVQDSRQCFFFFGKSNSHLVQYCVLLQLKKNRQKGNNSVRVSQRREISQYSLVERRKDQCTISSQAQYLPKRYITEGALNTQQGWEKVPPSLKSIKGHQEIIIMKDNFIIVTI